MKFNSIENSESTIITLGLLGLFERRDKVLYCCHNAGFFSNCTVTLWNIVELYRKYNILPDRIDFSKAFSSYRDQIDSNEEVDLYPVFFKTTTPYSVKLRKHVVNVDHHGIYKLIDFPSYSSLIRKYFVLSENDLKVQTTLIEKYDIDLQRTISIIYRGTDKSTEVKLASPELYLNKARELLHNNPDHKVLIQTDDINVRNLFAKHLGGKCVYFQEMPVTSGRIALHNQDEEILHMGKIQFGELLLAVTYLLSKSHYIVNHTGNMALWICLFRGNSTNVFQFDKSGKLITLHKHAYYWLVRLIKQTGKRLLAR